MRMRKKKHGAERYEACGELVVHEMLEDGMYELEIGCGKGKFITETAMRNPDKKFIALEKITDVIVLAAEKAVGLELNNVRFINIDVGRVLEFIKPHTVSRIYINFPDPWSKKGHYKRRLTYKTYLELYKTLLTPDGSVFFKTDDKILFDFSIEQFEQNGFRLENITNDLHGSSYAPYNIVTEYETNFSEKGFTINRLEAYL